MIGNGIEELIEELMKMAMESANHPDNKSPVAPTSTTLAALERNEELDLHRRYAPKARFWFGIPFRNCCKP